MKMKYVMINTGMRSGFSAGSRRALACAFTLVELLVSITFLVILMLVVTQVIGIVQRTWVRANSRVSQFREARQAFDLITNNLSQATLNTYWTTNLTTITTDKLGGTIQAPTKGYQRQSELHFICGPTAQVLPAAGGNNYPGHAVFFQAPLGVVNLVPATGDMVNTANMVNLLCGRGYFVEWGSDKTFRPKFLNQQPYSTTVPERNRLRLMEYSPTAEMNDIYSSAFRDNPSSIKQWYQDSTIGVMASEVQQNNADTITKHSFTRPVAENILAVIISPQTENTATTGNLSKDVLTIAPNYLYDSSQLGTTVSSSNPQGTQHLLPPILRITMIALDERSGEFLSSQLNSTVRDSVLQGMSNLFQSATSYTSDLEGTPESAGKVKNLLLGAKLNYRVYTTTIALKQGRWSN